MIPITTLNINYSLITFKKYGSNYESVYISDPLSKLLGANPLEKMGRLFPSFNPNTLDHIFNALQRHNRIRTFILLEDGYFSKVTFDGHVMYQPSEDSYLVNATMVLEPISEKHENEWLLNDRTDEIYHAKPEERFEPTDLQGLVLCLEHRFPAFSRKEFSLFLKNKNEKILQLDEGLAFLKNGAFAFPGFTLIQLKENRGKSEIQTETDREIEEIIKKASKAVFVKYGPGQAKLKCFGAIEPLLGYSPEELDATSPFYWESLVHPEDISGLGFERDIPQKPDLPLYSYYRVRHKKGHYIYVQETTWFFEDSETMQKVFLKYIEDVSHIKEFATDFLPEKDQLVPKLMPCLVYLFERNERGGHKIVFVSEGIKELLGLSAEEFLDKHSSFDKYIHPLDLRKIRSKGKAAFKSKMFVEHYFRIYTEQGKEKWVYATSSPLKKSGGKDIWAGYILDISFAKEVEETNQKHLKQFKSIYDNSPLAIINFDRDGIIQSVNKTLLKKIEVDDPGLIVGKSIRSLSSDEGIEKTFMNAFRNGKGEYEGPYATSFNHKHFYVRLSVEKMEHVDGYQALFEDITEKEYTQLIMNNVAEISARYSDKEFFNELVKLLTKKLDMEMCIIGEYLPDEDAVETLSVAKKGLIMPNMIYALENTPCQKAIAEDQNGIVIHCDRVCEKFPKDEILKKMAIESYCSTGIKDKSGKKIGILLLMDSKPIRNPKGIKDIITVLGDRVGADLQRIKNEQKLIESRQLYKSIAENFPKGTVDVLDRKFKYIYTEGSEYKSIGMDPKDLIGTYHLAKYDTATAASAKIQLDKVFEGETVIYEIFYNDQHYMKIGVPLFDDHGRVERILLVTQNITDAKKSEVEREKLIKDLSNHNDELQRFAYIVSHNLRAPIVNITSLLDLFDESDIGNPENKELIDNLKTSVSILNTTLTDLIEVVSIRKQKLIKVEEVFFDNVLNNIEKSLFKQLKEADVTIHRDFQISSVNYVYSHIENFLLNFMTNAIKYCHPDRSPEIWIETEMVGSDCVLTFRDNGIGIDLDKYKDRIFGLYQRFHSHVEGKGLGLYLVREQIRSLDGEIKIESEIDKGTTFKVIMKSLTIPSKKSTYEDSHYEK